MSLIKKNTGTFEYYQAQSIPVPHCFTTRLGGVSRGALASMNLGLRLADDPQNVAENFRILSETLGFSPEDLVTPRQIHSDIVCRVGREDRGKHLIHGASRECDAQITNEPGVALVVFTADCTPILLHDPVTGAVGAVHAGWRGTALGIVSKTVVAMEEAFGCRPENIRAAIGPNIGACCFETDPDVPQALTETLGSDVVPYIRQTGEKYHIDLKQTNALWLRKAGVCHIEISDLCTACRQDLFWSHRRVGMNRGSQGAVIYCKEVGI